MHVAVMRGTVACVPLYECVLCHKNKAGDGSIDIAFESPTGLAEAVLRMRPPASLIPVGWSSNLDGFHCEDHK